MVETMNPKIYRRQIAEIGIEDMVIDVSSLQKAMQTMSELDEYEKVLNKIKFNLHTDIRNLRVEYMQKIQEAGDPSNNKGMFGRKKTADKIVRKKKALKKELELELDRTLGGQIVKQVYFTRFTLL